MHKDKPMHPATLHKIVNTPNPNVHPTQLPDGSVAKAVILGDPQPLTQIGAPSWWPSALSDNVRGKMMRRFLREGYLPHILIAVCLGLLAEVYTTTSGLRYGKQRRVRLRQHTSPISDFGIAYGSARVTAQDKLAYLYLSDGSMVKGQDPDNHYWLYFTTVRGQEFILECGMFTFNMSQIIASQPYLSANDPSMPFVPAFFRDRMIQKNTPELHRERKRFSVLRNPALQRAVANSETGFTAQDLQAITSFFQTVSGKIPSESDKDVLQAFMLHSCRAFADVIESGRWKGFPVEPVLAIEADPGELDDIDDSSEEWWQYLQNWKKMKKSGKVGEETMRQAFLDWERKNGRKKRS
ncbi:hypothetical protein SERLADRAFT_470909 [Serpula lacrymans var. lacrymans S7.9]|nr:uncharacterized protein SERLADRAFT_470909 [Serpula lacrymans var. lacrymans S7.9]EGO24128.1 hypothetical protein SERLADRAFT_470909 [Serpula lacrymans var. lacrymans S7.9]